MDTLQTIQTISLDFYNNNIKTVNVKQMDSQSRYLKISCTEQGKTVKLNPETMTAFVRYKKPDGYYVLDDCKILEDGTLLFEFTQQMTVISGKATADILIIDSSAEVTVIKDDENGFVQLAIALDATDDGEGNVSVEMSSEGVNDTTAIVTVDNIEDIYNISLPILSTMTFYVNILPTAINHSTVSSSYEYDALIEGLARHVAIEKHMEELDKTLNANETQRQENETTRQSAETVRQTNEANRQLAETSRVEAENLRQTHTQTAITNCESATTACETVLIQLETKLAELEAELAAI